MPTDEYSQSKTVQCMNYVTDILLMILVKCNEMINGKSNDYENKYSLALILSLCFY